MAAPSTSYAVRGKRYFTAEEVLQRLEEWDSDDDDKQGDSDFSDSARESQEDMDISDKSDSESVHNTNTNDSDSDDGQPAPAQPVVPNRGRTAVRGPVAGRARGPARGRGRSRGRGRGRGQAGPIVDRPKWNNVTDSQTDAASLVFPFETAQQRNPGVQAPLDENSSELDCLSVLLSDDIQDDMIRMINEFAEYKKRINNPPRRRSVYNTWKPIDRHELLKFLAVLVAMGLNKKPSIKDYWSTFAPQYNPWYHEMFPRDRFEAIYHTMLHASDIDAQSKDKIEPFLNKLLGKFQEAFYPFQNLSLDEMVIGWKGHWKYKQYNASKPRKYHIKTFGLCDSITGYVYNLLVYFGRDTSYNPHLDTDTGQAEKVFEYLLRPLGKGHHVFADRYYTTEKLIRYLIENKTHYTGTLALNRKGFPLELKTLKLSHREARWYRSDDDKILCVMWKDKKGKAKKEKKPVVVVSTQASVKTKRITRKQGDPFDIPEVIQDYNMSMNGCDRMDQAVSYYGQFSRKTVKWWKRIFLWLLEICQANAYILYCLTRADDTPKLSLKMFKNNLLTQIEKAAVENLPPNADVSRPGPGRPTLLERFQGNKHLVKYDKNDRNCVVCSTPVARKRTNFVCSGCTGNPHLHPKGCFYQYHTSN